MNAPIAPAAVFLVLLSFGAGVGMGLSDLLSRRPQQVNLDLVSGKANYMPGAACVIAASVEQTPLDIIRYARACAAAHEAWLAKETP